MSSQFASFAVTRWQFTLLMAAMLVALGLSALNSIPRTEDPELQLPLYYVTAVLPGATPAEIEELVTKPLEDAAYRLDNVREVRSTSADGLSILRVEFPWGTDAENRYDALIREVNALRPLLPEGLARLEVQRARTTDVSVVQIALVSELLPMRQMTKLADRLHERLGRIPGVREAKFWGSAQSEMRVTLDLDRMAALHIPASLVIDALRSGGVESPIGTVNAGTRRFNVRYAGAFPDAQAVKAIAVLKDKDTVVHVGDLAEVDWASQEAEHITRFNGKRALFVTATQSDGQDVGKLTVDINKELDAFEQTLPGNVKLERAFAQATNVQARLDRLYRDFILAFVLVTVTMLPLGLRAALVVMIAIPLSQLIGIAIIELLGFSLNQLSIAGFVVSLGLLVDDAIVVTENIARNQREGADRVTAAVNGTGQIALAVIGCTACLMLAFLPLLALPEGSGAFIRSFPTAVLATLGGSFIVAMTIIPVAASRILTPTADPHGNWLLRAVLRLVHEVYRPVLHRALARPISALVIVLMIASLGIPMFIAIGTSLFPPSEIPQFLVQIELPQGASLQRTDAVVRDVERRLADVPEVAWTAGNVGRGNPSLYYNILQQETDPAFGEVAVSLKRWTPGPSDALLARLRTEFSRYPGARIKVRSFVQGPEIQAPIALRITGQDIPTLTALARQAELALLSMPELRDIGNPVRVERTDLDLNLDAERAAGLGVRAGAARQATQLALTGIEAAKLRDADGDDYPVTVRLPMADRNEIDALNHVFVPTDSGAAIPLWSLAKPILTSGPAEIDRFNRLRTVTLTAYVQPDILVSRATEMALAKVTASLDLPPGYAISLGGEAESSARSFAGLSGAVAVATLGILAVLVLEFGQFRTVAVVAGIIPLGLFGAVTALWLTGNSLSFTAAVGIVALIGIEIKNSILLVDFTEQLRRSGLDVRDAVEKAGELRFLPVLFTSVTAIGGLLPLALESNGLYSPMTIGMIGGLVSSTLMSRVATPVMYLLLARRQPEEAR